uniref:Uncharacterized protein n=1 Tax=Anguilla anguilla TaxID=7936 RepID=A0A0E9UDL1_ANGAN
MGMQHHSHVNGSWCLLGTDMPVFRFMYIWPCVKYVCLYVYILYMFGQKKVFFHPIILVRCRLF